jgi:hypothetical protein
MATVGGHLRPWAAVWIAGLMLPYFNSGGFTMSPLSRLLSLLMIVVSSGPALAGIVGPFDDGELYIPAGQPNRWVYHTSWSGHTGTGQSVGGSDLLLVNWDGSADLWLFGRLFVQPGGGGGGAGTDEDLDLITVYGKQSPGSVVTTGFSPNEGISFDGKERHWGRAAPGNEYQSYSESWVLANALAAELPGADLSRFDTTSGTDQFRVYRTTVPLAAFAVPEPSTWALGALGFVGVLTQTWRTRRNRTRATVA